MAEILITGIDLDECKYGYIITKEHKVFRLVDKFGGFESNVLSYAQELQSHGDLKDYDELGHKMSNRYMKNKDKWSLDFIDGFMYALKMVDKAPVVIPFSKGDK